MSPEQHLQELIHSTSRSARHLWLFLPAPGEFFKVGSNCRWITRLVESRGVTISSAQVPAAELNPRPQTQRQATVSAIANVLFIAASLPHAMILLRVVVLNASRPSKSVEQHDQERPSRDH